MGIFLYQLSEGQGIKIGGAHEARGEVLMIPLILLEGIGRHVDGNRCLVCIFQLTLFACSIASQGIVV